MWVSRCRDAIAMSHTASTLARTYAGMDVTKTIDFKASFNSTITRVLDEKLPPLISRTCASSLFHMASPAPKLVYMTFVACYELSIIFLYTKASLVGRADSGTKTGWYEQQEVDKDRDVEEANFQGLIDGGFRSGCEMATVVCFIMLYLSFSRTAFNVLGVFDLMNLKGVLFSMLPVIGVLSSAAWPLDRRARSDSDGGMGVMGETNALSPANSVAFSQRTLRVLEMIYPLAYCSLSPPPPPSFFPL
ncbi:MAG: hypothetical protein Q9170_003381 [Blastenia crenularia]